MKSITWTHPLGELDPRDDELSPRDPDTCTTIERPAVTLEMLEEKKRSTRPNRDSSEHRVLRQMSNQYAKYGERPRSRLTPLAPPWDRR